MRTGKILRRIAMATVGVLVLGTAVIGFAHTRPGRPLLKYLGLGRSSGGCPFGYDKPATAEARQAARRHFAELHRGSAPAAERPALGFTLDTTTRADILTWSRTHDVACAAGKTADLACTQVPASALPTADADLPLRDLWFTFDGADHLISVIAVRKNPSADAVSRSFLGVENTLTAHAGQPTRREGDPSAPALMTGTLNQATVEYRFHDYYAIARATNMGDGVLLSEEFDSLAD